MRIMFDTNVLFSMILFPSSMFMNILKKITEDNTLVLSSFVVNELKRVVNKKIPDKIIFVDRFLSELSYEMVYTPDIYDNKLFEIRDVNDYPVLYSAIIADVDIFITGDMDFFDVDIDKPLIMTPRQYFDNYC